MRIDPNEYAAFKQILKDFAETDYLPPEKYIRFQYIKKCRTCGIFIYAYNIQTFDFK